MLDFIRKWFRAEPTHHKRVYHFKLPYTIQAVYLHYGIGQLKKEGAWAKLPKKLQTSWERAEASWHSVIVTKEDIDSIDDATWKSIANKLNLKYDEVTEKA